MRNVRDVLVLLGPFFVFVQGGDAESKQKSFVLGSSFFRDGEPHWHISSLNARLSIQLDRSDIQAKIFRHILLARGLTKTRTFGGMDNPTEHMYVTI